VRNKFTGDLKSAILDGVHNAHPEGLEFWITALATDTPTSAAALLGRAYYSKEIAQLEREGRVTKIARVDAPLYTAWDLGISANGMMALWVFQVVANEIRVLDFISNAAVHELGTGKTRVEMLDALGCKIARVPRLSVVDGINAAKLELPRMWFNKATTGDGIEALRQYRTAYDKKLKTFSDTPHRDWTTDIADAARYMAIVARHIAPKAPPKAELPLGIPLPGLTMDQFMDIEDSWSKRRDRV